MVPANRLLKKKKMFFNIFTNPFTSQFRRFFCQKEPYYHDQISGGYKVPKYFLKTYAVTYAFTAIIRDTGKISLKVKMCLLQIISELA